MKILLIEDDVNINKHIKIYLENNKYSVTFFLNAEDAID